MGPQGLSGLIIPDAVRRRNRAAGSLNGAGAGGEQQGGKRQRRRDIRQRAGYRRRATKGAGEEARTPNILLGRQTLCQLSYPRGCRRIPGKGSG